MRMEYVFYFHQIFFSIFHAHRVESSTRNPLQWKSFVDGLVSPRMQCRWRANPEKSYRMVIRTLIKIHSTAKLHVFMALYKVIIQQFYIFLFRIFSSHSVIFFAHHTQTQEHIEIERYNTDLDNRMLLWCKSGVGPGMLVGTSLYMNAHDTLEKLLLPTAFSATISATISATSEQWIMNGDSPNSCNPNAVFVVSVPGHCNGKSIIWCEALLLLLLLLL